MSVLARSVSDSVTFVPAYTPEVSWVAGGLALCGLVAGIVLFRRSKTWPGAGVGLFLSLVGAAFLWLVALSPLLRFRLAIRKPTPTVTGIVDHVRLEDPDGHGPGSFSVDGVTFEFSVHNLSSGARRFPGLREGMTVRVQYLPDLEGNAIVALDTAAHAP